LLQCGLSLLECIRLLTKVDDGNSGCLTSDGELVNNRLDEVNDELPVVASWRVMVADTSRVVNHEHKVGNACCN